MAQNQLFEMPKQLRELAAKNVDQVRAAYAQFMDAISQAWSTAPSNVMTSGFRDVQALAIRFAKENAEAGFALAKELANARDIQGVMTLQGHYAQTQLQSYGRQAHELGRLNGRGRGEHEGQKLRAVAPKRSKPNVRLTRRVG